MKNKITNISVHFSGCAQGKRKNIFQSERIDQISDHVLLSPDQITDYERKAFSFLHEKKYKNISKTYLCVNFGENDNEMTFIQLLPKQRILINEK